MDTTRASDLTEVDAEVARLGVELARHGRVLHMMKAQFATLVPQGVDWAVVGLLVQLTKCGPTRQADLAEASLLDPSTVSRHVGQLVRLGLVERRPDPQDGRAVRLVVTDHGREIVEETVRRRNQAFVAALRGWRPEDLRALIDLLARFNDDLETFRQNATRAGPPSLSRAMPPMPS